MTSDRRASWKASQICAFLFLPVLECLHMAYGAGAVNTIPLKCTNVNCSLPGYCHSEYHCCRAYPGCQCFDKENRVYRLTSTTWPSRDCKRWCECTLVMNTKTITWGVGIQCHRLHCRYKSECKDGWEHCCPTFCRKKPSLSCYSERQKRIYRNKEVWMDTPCERCTCEAGTLGCIIRDCEARPPCPPGMTSKALPGECCHTYCRDTTHDIAPYKSCVDKSGKRHKHGGRFGIRSKWPCTMETCYCRHGEWECDNRKCPAKSCWANKNVTFGLPGQCCSICAGDVSCHIGGGKYVESGHKWFVRATSSQCACIYGRVHCLRMPKHAMPLLTTSQPTSVATYVTKGKAPVWLPILIAVLGVLVLLFLLLSVACLLGRCTGILPWKTKPRAASAQSTREKELTPTMHYTKNGDAEMRQGIDENGNQCSAPLITT